MDGVKNLIFVFDRVPDQEGCTFIEVENEAGESVCAGEWRNREDGLAELVVPVNYADQSELAALREELAIIKDECIDHMNLHKAWTKQRDGLQQRLTAAEQRNVELTHALDDHSNAERAAASANRVRQTHRIGSKRMSTEYLSYDEVWAKSSKKTRCCECRMSIQAKSPLWILTCSEQGAETQLFITCEACHAQRVEFCTEHFTPTQLLQDLEALRSALPYDSARPWAMLTNAVSLLRQRIANAGPVPRIPTTPTPLRGVRVVKGGLVP